MIYINLIIKIDIQELILKLISFFSACSNMPSNKNMYEMFNGFIDDYAIE